MMTLGSLPAADKGDFDEDDLYALLPKWDRTVAIQTAAGFKDNVLLSRDNRIGSPFLQSGLEVTLLRFPLDGTQFQFLVTAEETRFLSGDAIEKEQLAFAHLQLKNISDPHWHPSFTVEYFYQDQVLDVSTTEPVLQTPVFETLQIKAHLFQVTPAVIRDLGEAGWVEAAFPVSRQEFLDPLDDYWERGPKLTYGRSYGHRSEWSLSYAFTRRDYDTTPQLTADGFVIPRSDLVYQQHRFEAALRHYWDENRRWRTVTKAGYRFNEDNGSGFFDYNRIHATQQVRYRDKGWEITGEATVARFDYPVQPAGLGSSSTREWLKLGFGLRCEKRLTDKLRLFARFDREQTFSNDALEEYSVNTVSGGAVCEF